MLRGRAAAGAPRGGGGRDGATRSDIRAEHILLNGDGSIALSGVHNSVNLVVDGQKRRETFEFRGDLEWTAPEVIAQARMRFSAAWAPLCLAC